jgi:SAM-dependent methyltransferase
MELKELQHLDKKFTYQQTIEYWTKRSPFWITDIEAGEHSFSKELKDLISSLSFQSVLDYGCGVGQASVELFNDKEYRGCDITLNMVVEAQKRNRNKFFFWTDPNFSLALHDLKTDLIFTHTVLEHIPPNQYKGIINTLLDNCKIGVFVENNLLSAAWTDNVPHGFNHDYLNDLSKYGQVKVIKIKDYLADTNNAIYIAKGKLS